jgi:hypothetical protein
MSGTPSQKNDIAFGEASERENLDILQQFLDTTLERKGGYAVFDFENPNKTVFVELKSRRIKHDAYDTAIIGLNKIAFCETVEGVQYWMAFCYLDGIYVIQYDSDEFADFEVRHNYMRGARNDVRNKPQSVVMIPISKLTKLEVVEVEEEVEEEIEKKITNLVIDGDAGTVINADGVRVDTDKKASQNPFH